MLIYLIDRFLRLLSQDDWTYSPLVVDITNDLSPSDEKEINVSCVTECIMLELVDNVGLWLNISPS